MPKYSRLLASFALCCALLCLLLAARPAVAEAYTGFSIVESTSLSQPSAMGGGGIDDTGDVAGSGAGGTLDGSFLGAVLTGAPYKGMATVDFIVVALIAYLAARMIFRKRNTRGSDRFEAGRRTPSDLGPQGRAGDMPPLRPSGTAKRPGPENTRDTAQSQGQKDPSGNTPSDPYDNAWSRRMGSRPRNVQENAAAVWAAFSTKNQPQDARTEAVAPGAHVPADFDVQDFLDGARTLYGKLQTEWAARKLEPLGPFLTEEMMALLQKQAAKHPTPSPVEVLLVTATLEDVAREGSDEKATVRFNATMRFGAEAQPEVIEESWHFTRSAGTQGMWRLAGIAPAN